MNKIPVFDIGDTLMPCYRLQNETVREVVKENGGKPPEFDVNNFRIYNVSHVRRYLNENRIEAEPEKIVRRYKKKEEIFLKENNVFEFLRNCTEEFGEIGFISDNSVKGKKWFKKLLEDNKVSYNGFVVSEEVGVEKPDKKIFKAFLNKRSAPAKRFVYLGNNVKRDKACRNVGMDFIWVNGYNTFGTEYDGVSLKKPSLKSVKKAVRKLEEEKVEYSS